MRHQVKFRENSQRLDVRFHEQTQRFASEFSGMVTIHGRDGLSAYEIARQNGFDGSEQEWLASLHGKDGYTPVKGKDYFDGKDGYTPQKGVDYFDGKDGYTPIRGKDYYTEADKAEMVTRVIASLPVYGGEVE